MIQRYESYKPSGIPWVGEIPSHWGVKKNKFLLNECKAVVGKDAPKFKLLSLTLQGVILRDMENPKGKFPAEFDTYKKVSPGDLIFCLFDVEETPRTVGIAKHHGMITGAYTIIRCNDQVSTGFLYYYYLSLDDSKQLRSLYTGLRNVITRDTFLNLATPLPPREEQDRIVAFLDQKAAEIDAAIAKKERLIELLNEQKKIFLEHLVCRGLDSGVQSRNSGVDSVGDIPKHWGVKKLGHLANVVRGASPRPAGDPRYFSTDEGVSWVTVAEVTKDEMMYLRETKEFLTSIGARQSQAFHRGTVIFTNSGATLGVPKILDIDCCANDGIVAIKRLSSEVNEEFIYYFLLTTTERLREEMKQGGGQPNLNTGIVKSIVVPLPPTQEQEEIVRCINLYLGKQQKLIRQTRASIEQLQTLKESLVAKVITGKIKV